MPFYSSNLQEMFWGHESIKGLNDTKIKDFWQWTYSDILINKNREDFGLFLVAHALELTKMPRIDWGLVELRYRKKKIAVRTSGYIQGWRQKVPKRILFDISPKTGLDAKRDDSLTFRNREAEVYIFCVHTAREVAKADMLDLNQWQFYMVRTSVLDSLLPSKKKIGIRQLKQLASPIHHEKLKDNLDILIDAELTESLVL
jgi:hypothetical protein